MAIKKSKGKKSKPALPASRAGISSLRQLAYPKGFRIEPGSMSSDLLEELKGFTALQTQAKNPEPVLGAAASGGSDMAENRVLFRLLADMATGLWRLRRKMVKEGTLEPREEMSKAFRYFQSVWDALVSGGFTVQEHTHKPFDSGFALKVIAFQPTVGLREETIIETIKPTIYYKGRQVQMGEVVVGTPVTGDDNIDDKQ